MSPLLEQPVVVLVTGVSASGKSTVAQLLAERFARAAHVKGDVFRRMVVSGRAEMTADPSPEAWHQLLLRYRLAAATADAYAEAGFSVVFQDVVLGPVLDEVIGMVRTRPLCVVVLAPQPAVVAAREAGRAKTAYRPGGLTVESLDDALRHATPRRGLWLDTSDQTPDETVQEILDRAWREARVP